MKNSIVHKPPFISVITPSYNAATTIQSTIESVLSQDYPFFEYLVIDGQSTDGTVEIFHKYDGLRFKWISEHDTGIYNAMNKGINLASGRWILFLGADDELLPGVLTAVSGRLETGYAAVFGCVQFTNGNVMRSALGLRTLMQNTVHHQSVFYNADLFRSFKYDEEFKAISDYELNLLILRNKLKFKRINNIIALCRPDGTSSSFKLSLDETNLVRNKVLKNSFWSHVLSVMLRAYYLQKHLRGSSLAG